MTDYQPPMSDADPNYVPSGEGFGETFKGAGEIVSAVVSAVAQTVPLTDSQLDSLQEGLYEDFVATTNSSNAPGSLRTNPSDIFEMTKREINGVAKSIGNFFGQIKDIDIAAAAPNLPDFNTLMDAKVPGRMSEGGGFARLFGSVTDFFRAKEDDNLSSGNPQVSALYDESLSALEKNRKRLDTELAQVINKERLTKNRNYAYNERIVEESQKDLDLKDSFEANIPELEEILGRALSRASSVDNRNPESVRNENEQFKKDVEQSSLSDDAKKTILSNALDNTPNENVQALRSTLKDEEKAFNDLDSVELENALADSKAYLAEQDADSDARIQSVRDKVLNADERLESSPDPSLATDSEILSWLVGSPSDDDENIFVDEAVALGETNKLLKRKVANVVNAPSVAEQADIVSRYKNRAAEPEANPAGLQRFQNSNRGLAEVDEEAAVDASGQGLAAYSEPVIPGFENPPSGGPSETDTSAGAFSAADASMFPEAQSVDLTNEERIVQLREIGLTEDQINILITPDTNMQQGQIDQLTGLGYTPQQIASVLGSSTGSGTPSAAPSATTIPASASMNDSGLAAQFGYKYLMFEPGTQIKRQDMMVIDPETQQEIHALDLIQKNNLTDQNEIDYILGQTEYMDLEGAANIEWDVAWDKAAPDGAAWDDITPNREAILKAKKDYIIDQLELLELTSEVTEEEINDLAITSSRGSFDAEDIRVTLTDVKNEFLDFSSFAGEKDTGLLGAYKSNVAASAGQYMLNLSDAEIDTYVTGLYNSPNAENQMLLYEQVWKQKAKEEFPTLIGIIDQGMTPAEYFAPYQNKASTLLERQVDFMGSDRNLFNTVSRSTPADGTGSRPMTYTEMEKTVRSGAEWWGTQNAEDEARTIADDVGRRMGFVS
tara:strand:- start:1110 stop:3791 length:2682 start_codon:yes stop_codon:yes gene_type:complete